MIFVSPYPTWKNQKRPFSQQCECLSRVLLEDILSMIHGEVLRCGHCSALMWFDETFWPDIEYHYFRVSKPPQAPPLKVSIWLLKELFQAP